MPKIIEVKSCTEEPSSPETSLDTNPNEYNNTRGHQVNLDTNPNADNNTSNLRVVANKGLYKSILCNSFSEISAKCDTGSTELNSNFNKSKSPCTSFVKKVFGVSSQGIVCHYEDKYDASLPLDVAKIVKKYSNITELTLADNITRQNFSKGISDIDSSSFRLGNFCQNSNSGEAKHLSSELKAFLRSKTRPSFESYDTFTTPENRPRGKLSKKRNNLNNCRCGRKDCDKEICPVHFPLKHAGNVIVEEDPKSYSYGAYGKDSESLISRESGPAGKRGKVVSKRPKSLFPRTPPDAMKKRVYMENLHLKNQRRQLRLANGYPIQENQRCVTFTVKPTTNCGMSLRKPDTNVAMKYMNACGIKNMRSEKMEARNNTMLQKHKNDCRNYATPATKLYCCIESKKPDLKIGNQYLDTFLLDDINYPKVRTSTFKTDLKNDKKVKKQIYNCGMKSLSPDTNYVKNTAKCETNSLRRVKKHDCRCGKKIKLKLDTKHGKNAINNPCCFKNIPKCLYKRPLDVDSIINKYKNSIESSLNDGIMKRYYTKGMLNYLRDYRPGDYCKGTKWVKPANSESMENLLVHLRTDKHGCQRSTPIRSRSLERLFVHLNSPRWPVSYCKRPSYEKQRPISTGRIFNHCNKLQYTPGDICQNSNPLRSLSSENVSRSPQHSSSIHSDSCVLTKSHRPYSKKKYIESSTMYNQDNNFFYPGFSNGGRSNSFIHSQELSSDSIERSIISLNAKKYRPGDFCQSSSVKHCQSFSSTNMTENSQRSHQAANSEMSSSIKSHSNSFKPSQELSSDSIERSIISLNAQQYRPGNFCQNKSVKECRSFSSTNMTENSKLSDTAGNFEISSPPTLKPYHTISHIYMDCNVNSSQYKHNNNIAWSSSTGCGATIPMRSFNDSSKNVNSSSRIKSESSILDLIRSQRKRSNPKSVCEMSCLSNKKQPSKLEKSHIIKQQKDTNNAKCSHDEMQKELCPVHFPLAKCKNDYSMYEPENYQVRRDNIPIAKLRKEYAESARSPLSNFAPPYGSTGTGQIIATRYTQGRSSDDAQFRSKGYPQPRSIMGGQRISSFDAQISPTQGRQSTPSKGKQNANAHGDSAFEGHGRSIVDNQGRSIVDAHGRSTLNEQTRSNSDTQRRSRFTSPVYDEEVIRNPSFGVDEKPRSRKVKKKHRPNLPKKSYAVSVYKENQRLKQERIELRDSLYRMRRKTAMDATQLVTHVLDFMENYQTNKKRLDCFKAILLR